MTTPSQRAREAAAAVMTGNAEAKDAVRAGKDDSYWMVQAFAQFEAETLEMAAKVAEDYKQLGYMSDRERDYCHQHGEEIAELISALIGERP